MRFVLLALAAIAFAAAAFALRVADAPTVHPPSGAGERAGAEETERLRALFRTALDRAAAGEALDQGPQSPYRALRDYPLYPYLEAAYLRHTLARAADEALDARVQAFLRRYGDQPVTRQIRVPWLLSLAERGRHELYLGQLPELPADELLRCHWLDARLRSGRSGDLLQPALQVWLTGRDMPAACDDAFAWLDEQGALTAERYQQRIALALHNGQPGLARFLARSLPAEVARPWINAALVLEDPPRMIDRLTGNPQAPVDWQWLQQGFLKLTRRDSAAAVPRFERLLRTRQPPAEEAAQLRRSLALGLAYDRDGRALSHFHRLPTAVSDDHLREWHVRAALHARGWDEVLQVIDAMPEEQRSQTRWRYWQARALEQTGSEQAARRVFAELARDRSFHGFAAAARSGVSPDMGQRRLAADPQQQDHLQQLPAVRRARELHAVGMEPEGVAELRWALQDLTPAGKAQLALQLSSWGWHEQAIVWLAESGEWDDVVLRYPLPFVDEVAAAAKDSGVPAAWIYSVLRAESLYNPRAVSGAGARGLLQLMPATAREVARRHGVGDIGSDDLFDPALNIRLGAHYLAQLLERYDGHWLKLLAAYNAGPRHVARWRPDADTDADLWMESIAFEETRAYLARVLFNWAIFEWRLNGEPGDLSPWLSPVLPAGGG